MMKVMLFVTVCVLLLAGVSAFFTSSKITRQSKLNMFFGIGKSSSQAYKVNQGTANKGTYVPDGLTPAQYEAQLKAEEQIKAKKQSKFPKGKVTESLTEWMERCEKKGLSGKDMNLKGHRMVKAKYDSFYTPYSPI